MAHIFFAHGTRCRRCEYDLTHLTRSECPECGKIQAEQAFDGGLGTLSNEESAFASSVIRQPMPLESAYLAHMKIWRYSGAVVLLILCIPAVWAVMHWDTDPRVGFREVLLDAAWVVAPLAIVGYAGLMGWLMVKRQRSVRRLPSLIQEDVTLGKAELPRLEATHVLCVEGSGSPSTYVRLRDGRVLAFRRDAVHWFADRVGQSIELVVLPRSRALVGIRTSGQPMTKVKKSGGMARRRRIRFARESTMVILRDESSAFRADGAFETDTS